MYLKVKFIEDRMRSVALQFLAIGVIWPMGGLTVNAE